MSDEREDFEEPDEPLEQGGEPAAFTVTRPPDATRPTTTIVEPPTADLIRLARAAATRSDVEAMPWPAGLGGDERLALLAWMRWWHSDHANLNLGHDDDLLHDLGVGGWFKVRDITGTVVVPENLPCGGGHEPGGCPACDPDHWPAVLERDAYTPTRTAAYLHAPGDRHTGTIFVNHDDRIPQHAPPTGISGKPLKTLDYDDAIAVAVENMRRSKIPGRAPTGRPPATVTVIAALTPRERLAAAAEAVERGVPQATAARALNVRPDSLNRAIKRRERRA